MNPETGASVRALHQQLLDAWNRQDALAFASLFTPDGESVGFDGSEMSGREQMSATLGRIFADHPTARYVAKVRTLRELAPGVAVLRAVAGMVPRGSSELSPGANAVQVLVAVRDEAWRVASFQNTPAAYHGRPEAVQRLTEELRELSGQLPPLEPAQGA